MGRVNKSPELAQIINQAMEEYGLKSTEAGADHVGISYEWFRRIRGGHIPAEPTLERVIQAFKLDRHKIMVIAGYEQPTDVLEAVEMAIRGTGKLTEEQIADTKEKLKQIIQKHLNNHVNDKGQ